MSISNSNLKMLMNSWGASLLKINQGFFRELDLPPEDMLRILVEPSLKKENFVSVINSKNECILSLSKEDFLKDSELCLKKVSDVFCEKLKESQKSNPELKSFYEDVPFLMEHIAKQDLYFSTKSFSDVFIVYFKPSDEERTSFDASYLCLDQSAQSNLTKFVEDFKDPRFSEDLQFKKDLLERFSGFIEERKDIPPASSSRKFLNLSTLSQRLSPFDLMLCEDEFNFGVIQVSKPLEKLNSETLKTFVENYSAKDRNIEEFSIFYDRALTLKENLGSFSLKPSQDFLKDFFSLRQYRVFDPSLRDLFVKGSLKEKEQTVSSTKVAVESPASKKIKKSGIER